MAALSEESLDGHNQPSDSESRYYYYGLAGAPHLVARTSKTAWPSFFNPERAARTMLSIVGPDHDLSHKWCPDLRSALIDALEDSGLSWDVFYPIRIGQDDDGAHAINHAVVLLIILRPGTDDKWPKAMHLALRCRNLLLLYGISNVEVEIMRSRYVPMASSAAAELAAKVDWTFSQTPPRHRNRDMSMASINEEVLTLLPYAGCRIEQEPTPEHDDAAIGTMGVYVRLGDTLLPESKSQTLVPETAIFGLASRHVAIGQRVPIDRDIRHDTPDEAPRILSGGLSCISECSVGLTKASIFLRYTFRKTEKIFFKDPDDAQNEALYNMQKRCLKYADDLKDTLASFAEQVDDTARRTVGTVAYSPRHVVGRHGSLQDWAMVSMQDSSLVDSSTLNQIYMVGSTTDEAMKKAMGLAVVETDPRFNFQVVEPDANGFLRLHDRDLPAQPSFVHDRTAYLVAKRGQKTGLTFGRTNNIEAVRRNPFTTEQIKQQQQQQNTHDQLVSLHLLVLGFQGGPFSQSGDSGSCVFDCDGRVVGLVDGGMRPNAEGDSAGVVGEMGSPDVTLVTPIQSILDDIREFTGRDVHIV